MLCPEPHLPCDGEGRTQLFHCRLVLLVLSEDLFADIAHERPDVHPYAVRVIRAPVRLRRGRENRAQHDLFLLTGKSTS